MANYDLSQTGSEVQAYIDSIPVIDVTGTLSGSNIVFATNPYSAIAANYSADCGSIVRLTVGTDVYLIPVTEYDGSAYKGQVWNGAHNIVLTVSSSSASGAIDVGIDGTPTKNSTNIIKSGGVWAEIYGTPSESEEAVTLTADKYYNMTDPITNGASTYYKATTGTSSSTGTYCVKLAVSAGDKIKIISYNNSAAAGRYVLTDSSNNVLSYLGNASRSNPTILNITTAGSLYVNLKSYNSSTDGVWKTIETITGGLIVNNLTDGGTNKALSAEQGKVLNNKVADIVGVKTTTTDTPLTLVSGYYNTTNATAVGAYYYWSSAGTSGTGYTTKLRVHYGEQYTIKGKGNTDAQKLYVLCDINNYVVALYKGNARTTPKVVEIPRECDGGSLYVNFIDYDNQTDALSVCQVTYTGDIPTTQNMISDAYPMAGKKVILCGDSQLAQAGNVADTIKHIVGGEVYNWGVSGCRMSWRTNDGSNQYDAFSMVNFADCLVSGDFSSMRAQTSLIASYPQIADVIDSAEALYSNIGSGKDVILTIAYGSNDFYSSTPLGTADNDKTTYIGATSYVVEKLLTAYPRMTIILIGMVYRVYSYNDETPSGITDDSDSHTNGLGLKVTDYIDALLAEGKRNHILAFNPFIWCGRNKYTIFTLCPSDGVHPTASAGRINKAEQYARILTSV